MDELLVQAIGGAIANLVSAIVQRGAEAVVRTEVVEEPTLQDSYCLQASNGDEVFLTRADRDDLAAFLESPDVFGLATGAALTIPLSLVREDGARSLELAFADKAGAWCARSGREWHYSVSIIWSCLMEFCSNSLPGICQLQRLTDDDYDSLSTDPRLHLLQTGAVSLPPAVRQLIGLASDKPRLIRARQLVDDIRLFSRDSYSEMWLQHLTEDQRFKYDDLYIDRTLVVSATGSELGSQNILTAQNDASQRVVVIGDPGVGKSTLVRRFVYVTAVRDLDRAPLLIRVRELGDLRRNGLRTEIVTMIEAKFGIDVSDDVLADALSLGKVAVVFDGIDEITDIGDRRELIRLIETFGRRYPLTQILATSRRVGYPRAKFDENQFLVLNLEPYDERQVAKYVHRWFTLTDREQGEIDAFMYESRSVGKVRNNPLMLSLLCTLYRVVGYIPQNRIVIYEECADLLFKRWDAMRHIEQPFDHRRYGEKLMQELAYFFYTTPSSTRGLDEGQLSKLIASFFQDTAGIEREESLARAKSFLDFCADRAWLLSSVGSARSNVRRFAFTHQTFLEFFAAQATIRKSNSREDAVGAIVRAFRADSNYLMAELMVQEAEDKYDNAAEELLSSLIPAFQTSPSIDGAVLALAVRVGNATPLKQHTWQRILSTLFAYWSGGSAPDGSYAETMALLELSGDAARRLSAFLSDGDARISGAEAMRMLAVRYSRLYVLGESAVFDRDWMPRVDSALMGGAHSPKDPSVASYLVMRSLLSPSVAFRQLSVGHLAGLRAYGRPALGVALQPIDMIASSHGATGDVAPLEFLASVLNSRPQVGHDLAVAILEALAVRMQTWPSARKFHWGEGIRPRWVRDVLLWLRCVLAESVTSTAHPLATRSDLLLDQDEFVRLQHVRWAAEKDNDQLPFGQRLRDRLKIPADLPDWYIDWCSQRYSIVPRDTILAFDTNVMFNRHMNWWTGKS